MQNPDEVAHAGAGSVVLLVDDESAVRMLLEAVLKRRGFTVLPAANGAEALRISRTFPDAIDLILSDHSMPDMNGAELLLLLTGERPETRALLMTGDPSNAPSTLAGRVIAKPFRPEELIRRIRVALKSPLIRTTAARDASDHNHE